MSSNKNFPFTDMHLESVGKSARAGWCRVASAGVTPFAPPGLTSSNKLV